MFIGTFQLSASTSCWFRQECQTAEVSGLFRTALAEALYHREQLSSRAAAQKLLPKLATLLEVSLPATQVAMPEAHPDIPTGFPDQAITGRLSELGTLSVVCVTDAERPHWEAMMASVIIPRGGPVHQMGVSSIGCTRHGMVSWEVSVLSVRGCNCNHGMTLSDGQSRLAMLILAECCATTGFCFCHRYGCMVWLRRLWNWRPVALPMIGSLSISSVHGYDKRLWTRSIRAPVIAQRGGRVVPSGHPVAGPVARGWSG